VELWLLYVRLTGRGLLGVLSLGRSIMSKVEFVCLIVAAIILASYWVPNRNQTAGTTRPSD
jgi:hypothetical protein